jgi:hypothetical protein
MDYKENHSMRRSSRTACAIALVWCLFLVPVTAQQGHNPGTGTPATPVATAEAGSGWQVAEVAPLEIEGSALALSPDGAWLAGVADPQVFCVWHVEDLEGSCVDTTERMDLNSFAWAPDSSAVAFSYDAYRLLVDSDIMVYELADESLHAVTEDDYAGRLLFSSDDTESFPVDVMPAWSPDSQSLVFSRVMSPLPDPAETSVARVGRDGGEVSILTTHVVPAGIYTPMRVLGDDSVIYAIASADRNDPDNGIWRLEPDGSTTQLIPVSADDEYPGAILTDAWEGNGEFRITGFSPLLAGDFNASPSNGFVWFSSTGDLEPLPAPDDDQHQRAFIGTLSPDGGTVLALLTGPDGLAIQLTGPASSTTELPEAEPVSGHHPTYIAPDWSNTHRVLVQPLAGPVSYLLTLEPVN